METTTKICNCVRFYDGSPHHKNCPKKATKPARMPMVCNECSKQFTVSVNAFDVECPKCHGTDCDVR